jgi:hypothetical protein
MSQGPLACRVLRKTAAGTVTFSKANKRQFSPNGEIHLQTASDIGVRCSQGSLVRQENRSQNQRQWSFCRPQLDEQLMVALNLGSIMLMHSFAVQRCQESEQASAGARKMTLESTKEALKEAALADLSFHLNFHN